MPKPITLRDLAAELDLSVNTVSSALRGVGRVAPDTVQRVRKLAETRGYRPDALAAALRARRREKRGEARRLRVGYWRAPLEYDNELFVQVCAEWGYDPVLLDPVRFSSPRAAQRTLWAQGVRGVVINARMTRGEINRIRPEDVDWSRFAVVKRERGLPQLKVPASRESVFNTMNLCLSKIIEAGYRNIGFLGIVSESPQDDDARLAALLLFRERYASQGVRVAWRVPTPAEANDPEGVQKWVHEHEFDVLLLFPLGLHLLYLGKLERLDNPPALVSFKGDRNEGGLPEGFAGAYVDERKVLWNAFDLLHGQIVRGRTGYYDVPEERVVNAHWQDGPSMPRLS